MAGDYLVYLESTSSVSFVAYKEDKRATVIMHKKVNGLLGKNNKCKLADLEAVVIIKIKYLIENYRNNENSEAKTSNARLPGFLCH